MKHLLRFVYEVFFSKKTYIFTNRFFNQFPQLLQLCVCSNLTVVLCRLLKVGVPYAISITDSTLKDGKVHLHNMYASVKVNSNTSKTLGCFYLVI